MTTTNEATEHKTAAEILEEAADAFESGRLAWDRGVLSGPTYEFDDDCNVIESEGACLLGGMGLAAGYKTEELAAIHARVRATQRDKDKLRPFLDARRAVFNIIGPQPNAYDETESLWRWNDLKATKEDVIDVLKLAAKDLRNQEVA